MPTIYLAQSGSDANVGTYAQPKGTLVGAYAAAVNGDEIVILDSGDYFEDLGAGYLLWTRRVDLRGAYGTKPRIGGLTGEFSLRVNAGGADSFFENLEICSTPTTNTIVQLFGAASFHTVTFSNRARRNARFVLGAVGIGHCRLEACDVRTFGVDAISGVELQTPATYVDCDFRMTLATGTAIRGSGAFDGTTISACKLSASQAISFGNASGPSTVRINKVDIEAMDDGIRFNGDDITSIIDKATVVSQGNGVFVGVGSNNVASWSGITARAVETAISPVGDFQGESNNHGTLSNSYAEVTGAAGHGLLLGVSSVNSSIVHCTSVAQEGSVAAVLKGDNNQFKGNTLYGGRLDCLNLKGLSDSFITGNTLHPGTRSMGQPNVGLSLGADLSKLTTGNVIANNRLIQSSGTLIGATSGEQSDNEINGNVYLSSSDQLGEINGTSVTTLQGLRDAWGNGNDSYSTQARGPSENRAEFAVELARIDAPVSTSIADTAPVVTAIGALQTGVDNVPKYDEPQATAGRPFTINRG